MANSVCVVLLMGQIFDLCLVLSKLDLSDTSLLPAWLVLHSQISPRGESLATQDRLRETVRGQVGDTGVSHIFEPTHAMTYLKKS